MLDYRKSKQHQLMFRQSDALWQRNIIRASGEAVFISHFQKRPLVDGHTRYLIFAGTIKPKACSCSAVFLGQKKPGNTHIHIWICFQTTEV